MRWITIAHTLRRTWKIYNSAFFEMHSKMQNRPSNVCESISTHAATEHTLLPVRKWFGKKIHIFIDSDISSNSWSFLLSNCDIRFCNLISFESVRKNGVWSKVMPRRDTDRYSQQTHNTSHRHRPLDRDPYYCSLRTRNSHWRNCRLIDDAFNISTVVRSP